jgi:hypothetical protein
MAENKSVLKIIIYVLNLLVKSRKVIDFAKKKHHIIKV